MIHVQIERSLSKLIKIYDEKQIIDQILIKIIMSYTGFN